MKEINAYLLLEIFLPDELANLSFGLLGTTVQALYPAPLPVARKLAFGMPCDTRATDPTRMITWAPRCSLGEFAPNILALSIFTVDKLDIPLSNWTELTASAFQHKSCTRRPVL